MNKVKGPLAKKPMGSAKRNQGGPRKWSQKPAAGFDTSTSIMAPQGKKPKTKKPKYGR